MIRKTYHDATQMKALDARNPKMAVSSVSVMVVSEINAF